MPSKLSFFFLFSSLSLSLLLKHFSPWKAKRMYAGDSLLRVFKHKTPAIYTFDKILLLCEWHINKKVENMRQKRTMPRYSRSQSLSTKQLKLVFMREVIELILRYSLE